jgi:hypothetical protein
MRPMRIGTPRSNGPPDITGIRVLDMFGARAMRTS